jgi:hypothetical protein
MISPHGPQSINNAVVCLCSFSFAMQHQKLVGFEIGHCVRLPGVLRNSRKTGTVSSAPPESLANSFLVWRHASVPFALIGKLDQESLFAVSEQKFHDRTYLPLRQALVGNILDQRNWR